ncbi:hypothetical protein Tco_1065571 [Tanacetum coccineum]
MAVPPSPNHVFNFSADEPHDFDDSDLEFEADPQEEFEVDPQEDLEEEPKEDPKEEPWEALDIEVDDEANWDEEMNEPHLIFPYEEVGSPKPPPPKSSDSKAEMTAEGDHVQRVVREGTRVENIKLKRELEAVGISNTLLYMGQEQTDRELYRLKAWTYDFYDEMVQAGFVGVKPGEAIDVLAVYGSLSLPSRGDHLVAPISIAITMPPRRFKRRAIERMVQKRVAEAIAEYERNRTNPENVGGSGPANAGGVVAPDVYEVRTRHSGIVSLIHLMEQRVLSD